MLLSFSESRLLIAEKVGIKLEREKAEYNHVVQDGIWVYLCGFLMYVCVHTYMYNTYIDK